MTNHTPGPWEIKGQDVVGHGPNGYICTWSGNSANARLIAAAPEMLAMLEDIDYALDDADTRRRNRADLKRIIAKARGQE